MIQLIQLKINTRFEDVQNVAVEELERKLTKKELGIIEDKIGDYIDWYEAIDVAIQNEILHRDKKDTE